jgi:hypothetical protein
VLLSDDDKEGARKSSFKMPTEMDELGLAACASQQALIRLHLLSAASALCPVLANSDAYLSLVANSDSPQVDADLVFQLLNACYLVGGSLLQTEKSLEAFMANCDAIVPYLLQNAEQDLQASTTIVKKIPVCRQSCWAEATSATFEQVIRQLKCRM